MTPCPWSELPLAGLGAAAAPWCQPGSCWVAVLLPAGTMLPGPCLLHWAVG